MSQILTFLVNPQCKGSTYHLYISFKTDIAALFLGSYMNIKVAVLFQEIYKNINITYPLLVNITGQKIKNNIVFLDAT